jgi:hexokinase
MSKDMDGEVTNFSKEVKAPDVVGNRVGAETLSALKQYDNKERKIVILNDTVATLLGGMAVSHKQYSTYLGYIYGTGTNVCCIVNTNDIKKVSDLPKGRMLVNMECGGYNGFTLGDFDKLAINRTDEPKKQLFEKMSSGKYLSNIIYEALCGAEKEGEFSKSTDIKQFELKDVSMFLTDGGIMNTFFYCESDVEFAKEVCRQLIRRAAKLGAIVNAATAIATCTDKNLPVAIVAEGTTFNKLVGYRSLFEQYLHEFLDVEGISFEIVQGEELNLVGTLMATMVL